MRAIRKGPSPRALAAYQARKEAVWEELTEDDKQEVREALVREQRGLCAYCMARINAEPESTKIEHIRPRRHRDGLFDWNNLVACCDGHQGHPPSEQTCDIRKADTDLACLNVLAPQSIRYGFGSGRIQSDLALVNDDLNTVPNLNSTQLVANRKDALSGAQQALSRRLPKHGTWSREIRARVLERLRFENPLGAYFGIIESWLEPRATH